MQTMMTSDPQAAAETRTYRASHQRQPQALVIDTDGTHLTAIADQLTAEEVDVRVAESAIAAASRLRRGPVDLVVLHGPMSEVTALRESGQLPGSVPVIAIVDGGSSARTRALRRGAVDAMSTPVDSAELFERVSLALSRDLREQALRVNRISVTGGLEIDTASRTAWVHGQTAVLSRKQFELLSVLAAEPTRVFTKAELLRAVWGWDSNGSSRTLDSHACRLRAALAECGGQYVRNVWGIGYQLIATPPSS